MKYVERTLDINAHITNIRVTISEPSSALLSFDNLGYGEITAVKFNAKGYNSFGDIVSVSGNDTFFLIAQDLHIPKNKSIQNLKVSLPGNEIRRLDLQECQICYADGTVSTYEGSAFYCFAVEEFDCSGPDQKTLDALRDVVSPQIINLPRDFDNGWICSCGQYNSPCSCSCVNCNIDKSFIFKLNNPDFLSSVSEEHQKNLEDAYEKEKIALIEKTKKEKRRNIIIFAVMLLAVLFTSLIAHSIKMSERTTYASEDEMRKALQGTYTYYENGKGVRQIVISGDTATYKWRSGTDMETSVRNWDYRNGVVHTFEDLIVTNKGELNDEGDIYQKGGKMSQLDTSWAEVGSAVLKITVDRVTSNSSYTICTGSVKNTGKKTYKFVEVKGAFKDSDGTVLDTDWTYAVGSEGLEPGESSTFRLSVPKQSRIKSCTVTIKDYD